ncbi:hypothetical protein I545_6891 [Mycobacterium kansasii 662]|uniref:Uncharacterized protein n=1 Tax=Mycobacterium kansasii 662 TaxID=1299326 RepID=X7XPQ7_MYCKA|nr:hypothetical protein I545_6891 [Mycobacterium kansasii 662]
MVNNNWRGLVLDSSRRKVHAISRDTISLLHDLQSVCAVVTAENIDQLMLDRGFEGDIGLLHIDIDGNDYWVWRGLTAVRPESPSSNTTAYSGGGARFTVPYDPSSAERTLRPICISAHPCRAVRPGPI